MVLTLYTRPDNGLTLLNEVWVPAPPVLVDDELTIGSVKELSSIMLQTLERNPRTFTIRATWTSRESNIVIQNVKRHARRFWNIDYFATMIYLTCGKLGLRTVTTG